MMIGTDTAAIPKSINGLRKDIKSAERELRNAAWPNCYSKMPTPSKPGTALAGRNTTVASVQCQQTWQHIKHGANQQQGDIAAEEVFRIPCPRAPRPARKPSHGWNTDETRI